MNFVSIANWGFEELKEYKAFLTSPTGGKLHAAMVPALTETLTSASSDFGRKLGEKLQ